MDTELQQLAKTDRNPVQEGRYQELLKQSGGGSTSTGSYDTLLTSLPKASDQVTAINKDIAGYANDYLNYAKNAPTSLDFYTKGLESAGIPQMRKTQSTLQAQIYDLEDTLRKVEPNVAATTQNSIVTEGQRQGMVEARQKPLVENLGWLGQSLGRVSSAIAEGTQQVLDLAQLNNQDQARVIDAYKVRLDTAMQQGSMSLQAFIHDSDNILNVTLAKIKRGEQISDQEAQNAFELLKMQKEAETRMNEAKFAASQPNNQIIDLGARKVMVDANGNEIRGWDDVKAAGTAGVDASGDYYGMNDFFANSTPAAESDWEIIPQFNNVLDYNKWLTTQNK